MRRWDIDEAILDHLKSGPRTASGLFRELNKGMHHRAILTARGWKRSQTNVKVDNRTLMHHLRYLQRDGLIADQPVLKVLHHDRREVLWRVKYFRRAKAQGTAPPPHEGPIRPELRKEIHNPFKGEEGQLSFIRWLRDP
jgi:hypothetical protein